MKRVLVILLPILVALGLVALFWFLLDGAYIPMLRPSGEVAKAQSDLFVFATLLSLIVVIPVFTLLAYVLIKYRAGNTKARYSPDWSENRYLEGLWWGIPIVIIGVLGVVIYQTSHSLDPYKARSGGDPLEIQVVALRWKWLFIYPEQNVATLNYMPMPVDRPVKFALTGDAPMSSFWVPALGSQIYVMNGMESQLNLKADELGDYTGYTTNINGEGYAKMKFEARVLSDSGFSSWVQDASVSRDRMNMDTYHALARPKSETDERTYRLSEPGLFGAIMDTKGDHMMEGM